MSISSSNISRSSLRNWPISNTEVNTERLPSPMDFKGMELCYRAEHAAPMTTRSLAVFVLFVVLGQVYALGVRQLR